MSREKGKNNVNLTHLSTSLHGTSDLQHVHELLVSDLYKEKHATFESSLFLCFSLDRDVLTWEFNPVWWLSAGRGNSALETGLG